MSKHSKGWSAGLVATLVSVWAHGHQQRDGADAQIHIIRWLTALGQLSVPSA